MRIWSAANSRLCEKRPKRPGVCAGMQELIDEPSFYERGILQQMTHGEREMVNADLAGAV